MMLGAPQDPRAHHNMPSQPKEELRAHREASLDPADGAALLALIMHCAPDRAPTCYPCSKVAYGETERPAPASQRLGRRPGLVLTKESDR